MAVGAAAEAGAFRVGGAVEAGELRAAMKAVFHGAGGGEARSGEVVPEEGSGGRRGTGSGFPNRLPSEPDRSPPARGPLSTLFPCYRSWWPPPVVAAGHLRIIRASPFISVKGIKGRLNRLSSVCVGDMVMATIKKGRPDLHKKVLEPGGGSGRQAAIGLAGRIIGVEVGEIRGVARWLPAGIRGLVRAAQGPRAGGAKGGRCGGAGGVVAQLFWIWVLVLDLCFGAGSGRREADPGGFWWRCGAWPTVAVDLFFVEAACDRGFAVVLGCGSWLHWTVVVIQPSLVGSGVENALRCCLGAPVPALLGENPRSGLQWLDPATTTYRV